MIGLKAGENPDDDDEKRMSDEQKKKLAADCFRRGTEAMAKENWDYSIQMFGQSVKLDDTNLMFRQTLRGCEEKKYGNNKTGARMSGMKLMGIKPKISKAKLKKDWTALDQAAEEGLTINPWDGQLNADLGDACKARGDSLKEGANANEGLAQDYYKIAIFAYERAHQADKTNKHFLQTLAGLYEDRGEYDQASGAWMKVTKIDPDDGEARKKATATSTMKVIDRGGYEGADSTKDAMADHEIAKRLNKSAPGAADGPGMSDEADLQRACRKDPSKDNFLKLADFLKRNGKLEEAKTAFEKALELSGGDQDIQEQVEDVELDMTRAEFDTARQSANNNKGDEEAAKKLGKLKSRLFKRDLEVSLKRVERYPTDLGLKLKVGKLLRTFKKIDKAIPFFQQATQDHRHGTEAQILLGRSFSDVNKPALAIRQFEAAKDKLDRNDQKELFLDCYYRLGVLYEATGNAEAAENCYGEVLVLDYDYKDTLKRLERLQGGDDDGE